MANDSKCPIWQTPAKIQKGRRDGVYAESPRAGGRYFISRTAEVNIRRTDDTAKARLTTRLIDQRRHGVDCPEIMSTTVGEAERLRPLAVHERADRLLIYMRTQTSAIGKRFCFSRRYLNRGANSWLEHETFLQLKAWSESVESSDIWYLFEFLEQSNFIQFKYSIQGAIGQGPHSGKEDYHECVITPDGHAHLAELEQKTVDSIQAFVAMWFDDSMNTAYERGIALGIRDAGYKPLRIDRKDHNNKIDDEMIAEIRRSRFLVADFTADYDLSNIDREKPEKKCARGGVYYEAGFAHGLRIPVIFTCRADVIDKAHFDTRQYNHITWETPEELRKRLAQRIAATIGDGPLKA